MTKTQSTTRDTSNPPTGKLQSLTSILEMIRFSHTVFALPFALLAAVMAWRTPCPAAFQDDPVQFGWLGLLGIVLCMITARNASMSFNRIVDRDIDAGNPRTANRHLVTGALTVASVKWFFAFNAVGFFLSTLLFLPNRWPLLLAAPVLAILLGYSYTKRFTSFAHFWLGGALMLAPICAWIAIRGPYLNTNPLDLLPAILIGGSVMLWVAGFDIIYACQDYVFDDGAKLRSIPVRLGIRGALRLSAVCHALMVVLLATLPVFCPQVALGWIYWLGIAGVAALLFYEHQLVRPDDLQRVNVAFFKVNAVISIGLFLIVTADMFF